MPCPHPQENVWLLSDIIPITDLIGQLNLLVSPLDDFQEETQVLRDEHQSYQADLKAILG